MAAAAAASMAAMAAWHQWQASKISVAKARHEACKAAAYGGSMAKRKHQAAA